MNNADERNSGNRLMYIIIAISLLIFIGMWVTFKVVASSGITAGPDQMFGDQNLKTAVALIEMNKVRFGKYPKTLGDLKYVGEWDRIAINSVKYYTNADCSQYYVEVQRGRIGKPDLQMSAEFWQGTGYSIGLKP